VSPTRKQTLLLWLLGLVGAAAVLPYALALQAEQLAPVLKKHGLSLWTIGFLGWLQHAVLLIPVVLIGMWASQKVGFSATLGPWRLEHEKRPAHLGRSLASAFVGGVAAGVVVVVLDRSVFQPGLPALQGIEHRFLSRAPIWYGLLACLYGSINEELVVRLFLMSLLALGLRYVATPEGWDRPPQLWVVWLANVLSALAFGALHLPAARALLPLEALWVARTLLLNAVVGVLCGYLYARRGLLHAMLAHGAADLVLHVFVPWSQAWER